VSTYNGFSLQGKNAIVTGATRGIGLAIAKGFLASGATVTLCGRKAEGVQEALAQLQPQAAQVRGVAAHVGQAEDIARLIETAETAFGPVHILVNSAATNPYVGPIVDAEDWAWDKTLEINLKAPYRLARALVRKMAATGGGSIINVASIAGLSAAEGHGIYSVSKAGLIMLTKVLARELGRQKVRVNCICPGVIKTRFSETLWKSEEAETHFSSLKALGRIGTVDELVGAAIYLASEAASFTTGAILQVDGGMVI
jgi:NAD(P)-dependent dehydrogenase (short-subunit alcohol dehydrogenase family)